MSGFILGLFSVILVILSLFIVLLVLMQRSNANDGMGAAIGGGMMESAFGAGSGNILSKLTTYAAVLFFVIVFGLYLGYMGQKDGFKPADVLPEFEAPAAGQTESSEEAHEAVPTPSEENL